MVDEYTRRVDRMVCRAIKAGAAGWKECVESLPSVYPGEVLESVKRLVRDKQLTADVLSSIQAEVKEPPSVGGSVDCTPRLPVPHPLDFSWRFGAGAVSRLWTECEKATGVGDTIVLLGVPSMLTAKTPLVNSRHVILVDSDRMVIEATAQAVPSVDAIDSDLVSYIACGARGRVVVVDPPWYPEHMRSFLWAARQACPPPGGLVLLSFPPEGTRPGIRAEWEGLVAWAASLGMSLRGLEHGALPYDSPLFERNALAASGITNYPQEWRRADLATLAVTGDCAAPRPPMQAREPVWEERTVGQVRLRVRHRSDGHLRFADPSLRSIVPGDVLPSVSRRHWQRNLADVWTCGNRVFACAGPAVLLMIAHALGRHVCPVGYVERCLSRRLTPSEAAAVRGAARQTEALVRTESCEIAALHRD